VHTRKKIYIFLLCTTLRSFAEAGRVCTSLAEQPLRRERRRRWQLAYIEQHVMHKISRNFWLRLTRKEREKPASINYYASLFKYFIFTFDTHSLLRVSSSHQHEEVELFLPPPPQPETSLLPSRLSNFKAAPARLPK
jgi:hypothetical protein